MNNAMMPSGFLANPWAVSPIVLSDGRIRSFATSQVKGGLKITHKKHPGTIKLTPSDGLLLATIMCKNLSKEFQLLETFVGRLAYHFAKEVGIKDVKRLGGHVFENWVGGVLVKTSPLTFRS